MRKFYLLLTILSFLFLQKTNAQDTASFNFTFSTANSGDVYFINTSHLHGDAYRKAYWSFGDGTRELTGPLSNILHHYNKTGVYTTCLHIFKYSPNLNDSTLAGETCRTIVIQHNTADSCKANFSDTSLPGTTLLSKRFYALPWHNHNKIPEQICWNFGDGHDTCINYSPALAYNYVVYHNYAHSGDYNVCIKIRYQGGCESSYCRNIQVIGGDLCKADFSVESVASTTLTKYFTAITWNALQKKPVKICWTFGDGHDTCVQYLTTFTGGSYTVRHAYANYGQYNVCVNILYDGGCESHKCSIVNIIAPPPPPDNCLVKIFEVTTTTNSPERHFYAVPMTDRILEKLCWNFGDGSDTCISFPNPVSTSLLTITHHFPAPGVYHVCAKAFYAGGCTAYSCIEIIVRSNTNICGGYMSDSLTGPKKVLFKGFSVTNSNDHAIGWRWNFGDGTSAVGQQVSHEFINSGNYEVCLYITTDHGCETRICNHVIIQGANIAHLQLSPNPVTSTLHALFLSSRQEQVTISIYNANAIMVRNYSRLAVTGTNSWDFDLATLPAGIYSVVVSSPNQLANAIFFKQ